MEELAATVRKQKEELAMKKEAKLNADCEARKKSIGAVVQLCSQVMEHAVKDLKESRVVCFERSGTSGVMRPEDWEKVVTLLGEIGYLAEFVDSTPDIMMTPSNGKFSRYQSHETMNGGESFYNGKRAWSTQVPRSFVKNEAGKTLAIKVSLV